MAGQREMGAQSFRAMPSLARAGAWVLRATACAAGVALLAFGALLVPKVFGFGYQDSPGALYACVSFLCLLMGCMLLWLALYRRQ